MQYNPYYIYNKHGKQENIITGDLNCPKIIWNNMTLDNDCQHILVKVCNRGGFHQYVNFETHETTS